METPSPKPVPPTHRRMAEVLDRSSATRTCTLKIEGDTTLHDGIEVASGYVPRVGDSVWCLKKGTDWMVAAGHHTQLPACRIQSGETRTTLDGADPKVFDFDGGAVNIDTDGMADIAHDAININWPGVYLLGFQVRSESNTGALASRVASLARNGLDAAHIEVRNGGRLTNFFYHAASMLVECDAGDVIQLVIAGGDSGEDDANWGNSSFWTKLWAIYQT